MIALANKIGKERVRQFKIIKSELAAIRISHGRYKGTADCHQWLLNWEGDRTAALYYTPGNGWEVSGRTTAPLKGVWEGFDLMEQLDCNGVDCSEW